MDVEFKVEGLDAVYSKFKNMPDKIEKNMNNMMEASLLILHENVLPYPPQRENMVRPYIRKGSGGLAGSLGSTMSGGKGGKPTVYSVTKTGVGFEGAFGTNLNYAKYVIGESTATSKGQAWMHKGWWWTIGMVLQRSRGKIVSLWEKFVDKSLK